MPTLANSGQVRVGGDQRFTDCSNSSLKGWEGCECGTPFYLPTVSREATLTSVSVLRLRREMDYCELSSYERSAHLSPDKALPLAPDKAVFQSQHVWCSGLALRCQGVLNRHPNTRFWTFHQEQYLVLTNSNC